MLWRDACALAYLWETKGRGKECAELLTTDFVRSGSECVPCWDAICAQQLGEGEVILEDDKEAKQMSLEEIAEEGLCASVESVRDYVHPTRHSVRLRLDGSGPSNEVGDDGPLCMVLPGSVGNTGARHEAPFLVGAGSGEPEAGDDREFGHESG